MSNALAYLTQQLDTWRQAGTFQHLRELESACEPIAKFDGKEYLTVGDPGKTMVAFKKISATQIEETDRRSGKVFDVIIWTVAADGKTINVVDTDPVHQTKTSSILDKQP